MSIVLPALKLMVPELQFLNRMAICFALCLIVMAGITLVKPRTEPVVFEQNTAIALETSSIAKIGGVLVIATALLFYRQWSSARGRDRDACFKAFLNNNRVGLILFLGLLMHYFLAGAYGQF